MPETAESAYRAGNVRAATELLLQEVRTQPADARKRVFLAQLFILGGQWERAANQLSVLKELDAGAIPLVHAGTQLLQCERLRAEVFAGRRAPMVLGEPPAWIAQLIQALALDAGGKAAEAAAQRALAFEAAPATAGALNGEPFEWIADADSRLGPVLEVMLDSGYYWVPFERIRSVVFESPSDIRDLAWLPARITWENGGDAVGYVPARYPGSEHGDEGLILAKRTEWSPLGEDGFAGLGQRMLATDAGEYGLLDVRQIQIGPAPA